MKQKLRDKIAGVTADVTVHPHLKPHPSVFPHSLRSTLPTKRDITSSRTPSISMEGRPRGTCNVLAIPYPGRGHINPMMNLCKTLASKKPEISITFVVTDEWHGSICNEPKPSNMVFERIPNVVPSERVRAKEIEAFFDAVLTKMEAPLEQLLDRLDHQPDLIMADTFLFWAVKIGNRRRIPVASFWPMSSLVFCSFYLRLLRQNGQNVPSDLLGNGDEIVKRIPGISLVDAKDLPIARNDQVMRRIIEAFSWFPKAQYILLSSVYELELQAVDALKPEFSFPTYTIGPCIPYHELEGRRFSEAPRHDGVDYLLWLDRQPRASVLYVSQGSYLPVSRDRLDEIAAGLRDSEVRFLWVGRDESSRVKELCGDMGMVVPWCDQSKVLSHSSVGGFWTHCGWNSIKEGVFAGIPFLALPIAMDQFTNSKLVVDDWKIGWRVRDESREGIAGVVRSFMDPQDEESGKLRRRARELQEVCRDSVGKDGSSETSINAFIGKIISSQRD